MKSLKEWVSYIIHRIENLIIKIPWFMQALVNCVMKIKKKEPENDSQQNSFSGYMLTVNLHAYIHTYYTYIHGCTYVIHVHSSHVLKSSKHS